MEQQQAAVVFNNGEPKPNPKTWIKISYPEGYKGFKAWPEGTVKHYRKDAADLLIQRGIAVETDAPEGAETSTTIDTDAPEGAETSTTIDTDNSEEGTEDTDNSEEGTEQEDQEDEDLKNKKRKNRKK